MTEAHAREEICRAGSSLFARGYVHATAGNISMRLDEGGFLITPTDACLGTLDPAQLARVDAEGRQMAGGRASKALALHRSIYQAASRDGQAARCVIHTHSTCCVALTLGGTREPLGGAGVLPGELLAPITPYFVMKVGHVPVMAYHRPGAPETAVTVARVIGQYAERGTPICAVMLARIGPSVWGDSLPAAMAVLEELEETARLQVMVGGAIAPLDPGDIAELRTTFGARW